MICYNCMFFFLFFITLSNQAHAMHATSSTDAQKQAIRIKKKLVDEIYPEEYFIYNFHFSNDNLAPHMKTNTLSFSPDSNLFFIGGSIEQHSNCVWSLHDDEAPPEAANIPITPNTPELNNFVYTQERLPLLQTEECACRQVEFFLFNPFPHPYYPVITAAGISNTGCLILYANKHQVNQLSLYAHIPLTSITKGYPTCLAFSPNGRSIAIGNNNGIITLFNIIEEQVLYSKHLHDKEVTGIAFSPDSNYLVSCSEDGTATLLDLINPCIQKKILQEETPLTSIAWSSCDRFIAAGCQNGTAILIDISISKKIIYPQNLANQESGIYPVTFTPNSRYLVYGTAIGDIHLQEILSDPMKDPIILDAHSTGVTKITISPNGKWMLSASERGHIKIWKSFKSISYQSLLEGNFFHEEYPFTNDEESSNNDSAVETGDDDELHDQIKNMHI